MRKRFFSRIVAAVLGLSLAVGGLAGCGEASGGVPKTSAAADGDTVNIGWIYDMTGNTAQTQTHDAIKMAVDELNARGGVLGKKVNAIEYDAGGNVQNNADLAKKLCYESDCVAGFSAGTSAAREAMRTTFEDAELIYFYTSMYEGGVASKYCICTQYAPEQNILPLMEYLKEQKKGSKIYIVAADYNFGQICGQWIERYAADLGFEIVGSEYIPLETTNFSATVANIINSGADIIFHELVGTAHLAFYEQWYNAGAKDVTFVTGMSLLNGEMKSVDAKYLEGIYACSNFFEDVSTEGEAKEYVDKWKKYNSVDPADSSAAIYEAIMLWAAACEAAGSFDTEELIKVINEDKVSCPNGHGGTVSIDGAQHHCALDMSLIQVHADKQMELIETFSLVPPTYLTSLGIDLRVEAPNEQYSPMDE